MPEARHPRLGRTIQAVGLVVLPLAVVWGVQTDQLGIELLGGIAGFALILVGRSMQAAAPERE